MDSWILCGMQFGDEGKGTFVDYLAHQNDIDCIIRYNGGSQACHTVITPSKILHKFSQLGSGMFLEKCHTYITENMVVNLDNLLVEIETFSTKTGISIENLINRIHIHQNCFVVTPYHKLINKLREFSKGNNRRGTVGKGNNRRGTVGTGVSEVMYLLSEPSIFPYELPLGLQVQDIYNEYTNNTVIGRLEQLQLYVNSFYEKNKDIIWQNVPKEMKEDLRKEISFLLEPKAFFRISSLYKEKFKYALYKHNLKKCIYTSYELSIRRNCKKVIFEGSQGLLIDSIFGIKPNTTFLDTTNNFALAMSYYKDKITKIGIAKAFNSRHGLGVFPTETTEVSSKISDENQNESYWNGKIRFGWFDAVLLRYAQKINQVDELYISSFDKLDNFENIKICNEYVYTGTIDDNFKKIFEYYISSRNEIIITNIKQNHEEISKYLEKCIPKYITTKGWKTNLDKISAKEQLPKEALEYIKLIEKLTNIPITVISVGPTRNNKVKLTIRQ